MKHHRILLGVLAAMVAALALVSVPQAAPSRRGTAKVATKKAKGATRPEGAVKKDREAVMSADASTMKAPPAKGGPRTRAPFGLVHVDSRVPEYINIYIDGNYEGTMPPYGDLSRWIESGTTVLFAESSTGTWGPSTINLGSSFTWTLWP